MSEQPHVEVVDPVASGDPVEAAIAAVLGKVDAQLHRYGWDQPPSLWMLSESRGGGPATIMGPSGPVRAVFTGIRLLWLPIPLEAWSSGHPAQVVRGFARCLREPDVQTFWPTLAAADSARITAFALSVETWYAQVDEGQGDELREFAERNSLEGWAGRRETRSTVAVDRAGTRYMHSRFRDTNETNSYSFPAGGGPVTGGAAFDRRLHDALAEVVDALPAGT